MLNEQHGAGLRQQRAQCSSRVMNERASDDAQMRHAKEVLLQALAVRRAVAAAATRGSADDHGTRYLAVVHRLILRDVVDDLIEAERQKVAEHDLHDRAVARQGEPGGDAYDSSLTDRRGPHPARE